MPNSAAVVQYRTDALVITLPTNSPADVHSLLLRGINQLMQHYITHPEQLPGTDAIAALMDFQQHLLPCEKKLQKAFE